MCGRQGPEGRPLNVSPARKGWVSVDDDPSAGGAALRSDTERSELYRSATQHVVTVSA
jgi:hypothetical protein